MKLSIVIAIYNADKILLQTYSRLTQQFGQITNDYEILFRDDASIDNSWEILQEIANRDSKVKVFSNHSNRGLGFTLRELFKSAKGEVIIYLDTDLSFDIAALPILLNAIESADVVVASRYKGIDGKIPFNRWILSRSYYLFSKLLFAVDVKDLGSGFVLFRREVLEKIGLVNEGFDIHIEIFSKLRKANFCVKEIPVAFLHVAKSSTFKIFKHGPQIIWGTLRYWQRYRKNK